MDKITIDVPDGFRLVKTGESKWELQKIEFPKTWDEFCETHPVKEGECFIGEYSDVFEEALALSRTRLENFDKAMIPDRKTAEAFLALMQLIQLRNCYNGDWVPDWTNYGTGKYVIINRGNEVRIVTNIGTSHALSFESKELATEFLNNFKDLIEIAKPLI